MRRRCIIIDAYSWGDYHEVINAGYVLMLMQMYESITYIAEAGACDNVTRQLKAYGMTTEKIHFVRKSFPKPGHGVRKFMRLLRVSWANYWHYMHSPSDADVFFNNNLHLGILFVNYLSFGKKNRIFSLCHAEMEMIDPREGTSFARKIAAAIYRTAFCHTRLSRKMHFILLSPDMVTTFRKYIREENRELIHWIDHCYIRPEMALKVRELGHDDKIRLGLPGAITPQRGLPELQSLLMEPLTEGTHFYAISYMSEPIDNPRLTLLNTTGRLSTYEEYGTCLAGMDAVLLLYRKNSYRLTASGAALEAIWQGKPIISLRNGYVDYLFKRFGPLGYICEDIAELKALLDSIDKEKLSAFSENLAKARTKLLPSEVCNQLKAIVFDESDI